MEQEHHSEGMIGDWFPLKTIGDKSEVVNMARKLPDIIRRRVRPLLGSAGDAIIARRVGCSPSTVFQMRASLGIAAWRRTSGPISWSASRIRQLGTSSDADLADRWCISTKAVMFKRRSLSIPAFGGSESVVRPIPREARLQLGKVPDAALARQHRVPAMDIAIHRRRAGISPFHAAKYIVWTPAMLRDLKRLTIAEMARQHNITIATVRVKRLAIGLPPCGRYREEVRWSRRMLAALGMRSDQEFANMFGIGKSTVNRKRRELGIPRAKVRGAAIRLQRR